MLFKEQIEKRLEQENLLLNEAVDKFVDDVGLQSRSKKKISSDNHAIKSVLEALGITGGNELDEEDSFMTKEELLTRILNPRGIMYRQVELTGEWWKSSVGPMLGFDKEGGWVALVPLDMKVGYTYINKQGEKVEVNKKRMKEELQAQAICFFPALPMRKINVRDLLVFMTKGFVKRDIVRLMLISLFISILGMLVPYVNKQIFDTVIPNGTKTDIIPVASLLIGATIGSILFGVIRSWMLKRMKELVSIRVEPAVMARICGCWVGGNTSSRRFKVLGASLVWRVPMTKCPVSDAVMAFSIVSRSCISPITMISGSSRRAALSAFR